MVILEYVNTNDGTTLHEVCEATGYTRGTAHRVLETLRHERYLRKDIGSPRYWMSERVRALSEGYKAEWWIEQFAARIIHELGKRTKWPVKLLTPSGHEMVTRATTDFESPFTDGKFPTGFHVSMVWTAAGLVHLAHLDEATRRVLIDAAMRAPQRVSASSPYRGRDLGRIDNDLDAIRKQGFHIADHPETSFYSMAVPVLIDGAPLGSIAVFLYRAAVPRKDAIATFLPMLQEAAAQIALRVSKAEGRVLKSA